MALTFLFAGKMEISKLQDQTQSRCLVKVGDLVKHKSPKFSEHEGIHLVVWTNGINAFQILGHSGYHPPCDWEVINESR